MQLIDIIQTICYNIKNSYRSLFFVDTISSILPLSPFGFHTEHGTDHQVHLLLDDISISLKYNQYCS